MRTVAICTAVTGITLAMPLVFGLGLLRKPRFISHFEEAEYGGERPFAAPVSAGDGLAVYAVGRGEPLLLFPYPHADTCMPMAQEPLANLLTALGRKVVTFDVPGAYRSKREPVGDMAEMLTCADETLERLGIDGPVDVVGHSMGSLCALAYAIERPGRVRRLVLVGSMSGFPAVTRWGMPGSCFRPWSLDFWRVIFWGIRAQSGRADLALHKRLQNLMGRACYADKTLFTPLEIHPEDSRQGVPIRMIWSNNVWRRLSYADRLGSVVAPALVCVGRHDAETPVPCSRELVAGIPASQLVIFETSGHMPFIEQADEFSRVVGAFLDRGNGSPAGAATGEREGGRT